MKIGIINWKEGETDPFTVFSLTLREEFEKWGREVVIIPYAKEIGTHLPAARAQGLDFVVTWQGLGSRLRRDGAEVCLWDEWQLPLFCLHGDHPCQNPANHFAGSRYVRHFYSAASFTRYANRHFPRVHAGLTFKVPLLHRRQRAPELSGDFFVFAKNITEPTVTIERWRQQMPPPLLQVMMDCAEVVRSGLSKGQVIDPHAALDEILAAAPWFRLEPRPGPDANSQFHFLHHEVNMLYRNLLAVNVLAELKDVPLRVVGRGWERYAARAPACHTFAPPRTVANSEDLFLSRWGIVDVAPAPDSLHDRTLRSLAREGAFLSGSNLAFANGIADDCGPLFFDAAPASLRSRAEQVMQDPAGHRERCEAFSRAYRSFATHFDLLRTLELTRCGMHER
jgi:hypothetical protein